MQAKNKHLVAKRFLKVCRNRFILISIFCEIIEMAQKPAYNFSVLLLRKKLQEKRVSMEERIREFRSNNPDTKPLVLVDLMHIDKIQCGERSNIRYRNACGPYPGQLVFIESVFQFLYEQCRLVFFVDGPNNRDHHEDQFSRYRTCRKDERYERDMKLIEDLDRSENYKVALHAFKHIPTDRILFDSIVSMAQRYGSVVHALENPRSMEMARYVVDHPETLAVMGKSSSVLLTADSPQLKVWYLPELNVKARTVTELDAGTVWDKLCLQSKEKRLLMAALLPGSYVGEHESSEDVGKCHSIVRKIPESVREVHYKDVVKKLFAQTNTTWDQLKLACELYDVNQITPSKQVGEHLTSFAYDITHNRTSTITVMLNHYRYWSARNVDFHRLFVRFYRRLAGVVLKRSGASTEEPTKRRIFIKRSHEAAFEYELVDVEFPDFDVGSAADMQGDSALETNFDCLKFILDLEDTTAIRRFATDDENRWKLLDYLTVQYMMKEHMISEALADTIMKTVESYSAEQTQLPHQLDMDAFHATFMYVRWRCYVREALVNAGFPDSFVDHMCRLDGSRLQMLVQQQSHRPSLDGPQNAPAAV